MKDGRQYKYNRFIQVLPGGFSLAYSQAQRNLHCNDVNVLEYFERRLDDHIYVIKAVIDQC